MRFSLVAVLLAAAATAAPMPTNNIDIEDPVGDVSTISGDLKRGENSGILGDITDVLGNVKRDTISDLESKVNALQSQLDALLADALPSTGAGGSALGIFKRDEISDLVRDVADLLGNVKRDEISDLESEADDLISEMEAAAKAAE